MLEARQLVKRYYGVAAVSDVSFVVQAGEVMGYLGPNGSGKTTTVKILTTLLEPTAGEVYFNGKNVADDPLAFRRRLGYVPEEPHLYPFLSGREYLEFVGRLRELPESTIEKKIPASYSKGMKQKVLITAALLHNPDLLIFDEPDSGLDVTTALVLRHLVQQLAREGKAVLYSSHVLEVVEKLCSKVMVLHRGKVVADASVDELRSVVASKSLEEVFAHLVLREDPETTAHDIATLVTGA
jgi:ABC-2 type transport system ATP-binding protein